MRGGADIWLEDPDDSYFDRPRNSSPTRKSPVHLICPLHSIVGNSIWSDIAPMTTGVEYTAGDHSSAGGFDYSMNSYCNFNFKAQFN